VSARSPTEARQTFRDRKHAVTLPPGMADEPLPVFYFDVGSPYAWLAAERIEPLLGSVLWRPVLLGGIFAATGRSSWARTDRRAEGIAEIEDRAARYGLPRPVWPDPWPNDGLHAMRLAAAMARRDLAREFGLAAMRLAFTEGAALSDPGAVAVAIGRCGLDPDEVVGDAVSAEGKTDLRRRTEAALAAGVTGVPSVISGEEVHWGDDQLEALAVGGSKDASGA
jgi:2-hydroxychromene-2-carboxylate isomerase